MKKFLIFKISLLIFSVLAQWMCTSRSEKPGKPGLKFEISFSSAAHQDPITGRVYVIISKEGQPEPVQQITPKFHDLLIWGTNVSLLEPGEAAVIDQDTFGFPLKSLMDIPSGDYYIQGFINVYTEFKRSDGHTLWLHNDQWEGQRWHKSPGNIYSDVKRIYIDPSAPGHIGLSCTNVIPPIQIPPDTQWAKRIKFQSKILTEFWGQPIYLGATILLPKGYDTHPDVFYPVNYVQGHFNLRAPYGFTPKDPGEKNSRTRRVYEFYKFWTSDDCPRMIAVTFQHPCPYFDDSYAVNSANVGPYGDAIMNELIPFIEETFRIIRKPFARVLSGGSTGGWESFALQVFHPDFFGGTWTLYPDPLDFRAFTLVNIYEDKNAYYKEYNWLKVPNPLNRTVDGHVTLTMEQKNLFELVEGDQGRSGEQLDIFQAVFGPVGPDGYPQPLFDKLTGEIDPSVAEYWREHYDLRYYLEKNWSWLGPKLVGKIHIFVGDMDNMYLNNAVRLVEEFLEKTENPYYAGVIKYGDGQPHGWGPRGKELFKLFEEHITKHAPAGEDTSKWKY